MNRRMIFLASAGLAINIALPGTVRADQAILANEALYDLSPGESVEHTASLIVSRYGMPTVVFDGSSGFADDETVVATITLTAKKGIGTVKLLSPSTLTGITTSHWTADPPDPSFSEMRFDPPISLRYTAPTASALHCDDRPGSVIHTSLGIDATLVGSAGTKASFSSDSFPGTVMFDIICPVVVYEEAPTPTVAPKTPAPAKTTAPIVASPSLTPTPTPTPVPTPAPTAPVVVLATSSPTAFAQAIVDPTPSALAAPTTSLAADMTPTAISLGAVAVAIVAGLGAWLVRRRRSA